MKEIMDSMGAKSSNKSAFSRNSTPKMAMGKYMKVGSAYAGAAAEELLSDLAFTEVDKALGRSALPIQEQLRPYLDLAVAVGAGYFAAEYMDDARYGDWTYAAIGAGAAAIAHDTRDVLNIAKLYPFTKTYARVQGGRPQLTQGNPTVKPQRTFY